MAAEQQQTRCFFECANLKISRDSDEEFKLDKKVIDFFLIVCEVNQRIVKTSL